MNVDKLLSRKFIASMTALASAHLLVMTGKIADGVYSAVVIATIAAYIAGNVTQYIGLKDNNE